jgi:hypothetical protein
VCFISWSKVTVICKYGKYAYFIKAGKQRFPLTALQLTNLTASLDWMTSFPDIPVRLSKIYGHEALPADFMGVPFETFLVCDNLYQGYIHTQDNSLLEDMAVELYGLKRKRELKPEEYTSIFYWFASLKQYFARRFPNFLQTPGQDDGNLLGSARNIGSQLQESMDAQIRALTKGDITLEQKVLSLDTWRALTELEAQAKEYQQIKNQTHGA